jgi:hypothetical protein
MIVVGENRVIPTLLLPRHKLEFQLSTTILLPYSCGKSAYRLRNSTFEDRFWESLVEPIINLSRTYMCILSYRRIGDVATPPKLIRCLSMLPLEMAISREASCIPKVVMIETSILDDQFA